MTSPAEHPNAPGPHAGSPAKLARGQLRTQVLSTLQSDPMQTWSVTQLAHHLDRSSGAVGQALQKLAHHGWIQLVGHAPRRYRARRDATAAVGSTPPKPRVRRPNGEWYVPRTLADSSDITVLRRLRGTHLPVLLYGPPGTGKTALVEAAFPDVVTVAGHGDTYVEDLLGGWEPAPGGGYRWTYGPLPTAMREGRTLFIDDASLIPPRVLAVLYPAMDGRGTITIPAHQHEQVTASAGFYVIAGHNPGSAVLTDALASRFTTHIEVTTDFALAIELGVPQPVVTAAQQLNDKLREGLVSWAPQLRELLGFARLAEVVGDQAAAGNLAALAPATEQEELCQLLTHHLGTRVTPLALGEQL